MFTIEAGNQTNNFGAENKRFVRVTRFSFCSVLRARSALL